jgi:recombination protein RecA
VKTTAINRLESLLQARKLDGTLARGWEGNQPVPASSTGIAALDSVLGGGWRRGEVSEVVGPSSAGRTGVLVAAMAAATRRGDVVGLVDAVDRFDPESAREAGLDLERVLWVRGPCLTVELARPAVLDRAVRQAIRALDLLLRAGGFAIVALDVADVPARFVRALPHPTWMRLAHANEGRETVCLLVGSAPMGRSARGASVSLESARQWTGHSAQSRRFAGFDVRARVVGARSLGPDPHWSSWIEDPALVVALPQQRA